MHNDYAAMQQKAAMQASQWNGEAGAAMPRDLSAVEKLTEWAQATRNIASLNLEMSQRVISRAFGEPPSIPTTGNQKPTPVPNGALANLDETLRVLREIVEMQTSLLNRIETIV